MPPETHSGWTLLRIAGWVVMAGFVLSLILRVLIVPMLQSSFEGNEDSAAFGQVFVAALVVSLIVSALITGGILYWIGWTIQAWGRNEEGAYTNAKVLAILGLIVHGLMTLGALVALATDGNWAQYSYDDGTTRFSSGWISTPFSIALVALSIMMLSHLGRPETKAVFGR